MTNQLTPLQCPSCGGLLRSLDARVWQCAYCESRYMLLGEETPVPGLTRVVDGNDISLYLYDPEYVRWDSPRDVKQRARAMGLAWEEGIKRHIGGWEITTAPLVTHPGKSQRAFLAGEKRAERYFQSYLKEAAKQFGAEA